MLLYINAFNGCNLQGAVIVRTYVAFYMLFCNLHVVLGADLGADSKG